MKTKFKPITKQILADTVTPVGSYLKVRDMFPNSLLRESSDYHGTKGSYSFICMQPVSTFSLKDNVIRLSDTAGKISEVKVDKNTSVIEALNEFRQSFECETVAFPVNGIFGYITYDGIRYFESIDLTSKEDPGRSITDIHYGFYKYIIAVNHFHNSLQILENLAEGETSEIERIESLLMSRNFASYKFEPAGTETSNMTDEQYMSMVTKGKEHCQRGDVFQIVMARQYRMPFKGDEFNVYRTLRSINPSPYLFYFDYGSFRIFGSSPEAQLEIQKGKAEIHPIAGTFRRTGNDEQDKKLAEELAQDKKENAEHVMLVDLARNDLSRNAKQVHVERYKEIQYFSHVLHMVSVVSGDLEKGYNPVKVMADSFPAGTLSGAPKHKAMQLIDKYEGHRRGYYGGCIGYFGFNGDCTHAIVIRSFLSKDNTLFYQAGAGIVLESKEENEKNEVNNKLAALKRAIEEAKKI